MDNPTTPCVLHFKDVLIQVLSFLKAETFLNSRLVCKDWNDAALCLFRQKLSFDLNGLSFWKKKKTSSPPHGMVNDVRLFSSIAVNRFSKEELKKCRNYVWWEDEIHSKLQVLNWKTTFTSLCRQGATIRELKISVRSTADIVGFIEAANKKQLLCLEVIQVKLFTCGKIGEGNSQMSKKWRLEPYSLDALVKVNIQLHQCLMSHGCAEGDLSHDINGFLNSLLSTAQGIKHVQTDFFGVVLSDLKQLQQVTVKSSDLYYPEIEKRHLETMLNSATARVTSLTLHKPDSLCDALIFPKVRELRTCCLLKTINLRKSFPALEKLVVANEREHDADQMQKRMSIVTELLLKNPYSLKLLEMDIPMKFNYNKDFADQYKTFVQLASTSLDKENGVLVLSLHDSLNPSNDPKVSWDNWNTVINAPVHRLIVKPVQNQPLDDVLLKIANPLVQILEESRPSSLIEFDFEQNPDLRSKNCPSNFSKALQKLKKRWGTIKLKHLTVSPNAFRRMKKAIKELQHPIEIYCRCEKFKPPVEHGPRTAPIGGKTFKQYRQLYKH